MTRCRCGHEGQIHGANDAGYLEHEGPRNTGRCSASRCYCETYTPVTSGGGS